MAGKSRPSGSHATHGPAWSSCRSTRRPPRFSSSSGVREMARERRTGSYRSAGRTGGCRASRRGGGRGGGMDSGGGPGGGGEADLLVGAVIPAGNWGGPVVNLDGKLVGIALPRVDVRGRVDGFGHAVPASIARKVAADLADIGR